MFRKFAFCNLTLLQFDFDFFCFQFFQVFYLKGYLNPFIVHSRSSLLFFLDNNALIAAKR